MFDIKILVFNILISNIIDII